jgi:hypothetical protein
VKKRWWIYWSSLLYLSNCKSNLGCDC